MNKIYKKNINKIFSGNVSKKFIEFLDKFDIVEDYNGYVTIANLFEHFLKCDYERLNNFDEYEKFINSIGICSIEIGSHRFDDEFIKTSFTSLKMIEKDKTYTCLMFDFDDFLRVYSRTLAEMELLRLKGIY